MEQWAVRSNNSLQHYGVKGMKWGIRKEKETSSRSTSTKKKYTQSEKDVSKMNDRASEYNLAFNSNRKVSVIKLDNGNYAYEVKSKKASDGPVKVYKSNELNKVVADMKGYYNYNRGLGSSGESYALTEEQMEDINDEIEFIENSLEKIEKLNKKKKNEQKLKDLSNSISSGKNALKNLGSTLSKTLSNMKSSAVSTIKKGKEAVNTFLRNSLNIQTKTKVTRGEDALKKKK